MVLAPAIPLLPIIVFVVVLGLAATQRQWSDGLVSWLKGLGRVGALIAGPTGALAVKMSSWITHRIGEAFDDVNRLATTWLSAIYQYYDLVITNALEWPLWLWRLQRWLLFAELPKLAKAVPTLATKVVHSVTTRVVRVERTIVKLPKLTRAQAKALIGAAVATYIHPYLADLQWLRRHFSALTHAIPRALPVPQFPTFPNIWKRLRALERKLTPAAVAALVVAALARMGLNWIRCNKTKRVGKAICGLDESLIDKFLLDALAIFGVVSIVEFAEGLLAIEDEAVSIMGSLVREWPT